MNCPPFLFQATESELGDVDLSGLPEAAVDSEEEEEEDEDLERASDTLLGRDLVRECLEKEPADRNDDDIGQFKSVLRSPKSGKAARRIAGVIFQRNIINSFYLFLIAMIDGAVTGIIHHSARAYTGDTQMPLFQKYPSLGSLNIRVLPGCIFKQAIRESTSLTGPSGVLEEKVTTSESREAVAACWEPGLLVVLITHAAHLKEGVSETFRGGRVPGTFLSQEPGLQLLQQAQRRRICLLTYRKCNQQVL